MRGAAAFLLAASALSAGCVTELITAGPLSNLDHTCRFLDPGSQDRLELVVHVQRGVAHDPLEAATALQSEVVRVTGREAASVERSIRLGPERPAGGWDEDALAVWAGDQRVRERGLMRMHVLWLDETPSEGRAGAVLAPGVVAVAHNVVLQGAQRLDRTPQEVATPVLLHQAGHALGVVNQGIPVQDRDIAKRENPPRHDPDPGSVMHVGWHHAEKMQWTEGSDYTRYPEPIVNDWRMAFEPPHGMCTT